MVMKSDSKQFVMLALTRAIDILLVLSQPNPTDGEQGGGMGRAELYIMLYFTHVASIKSAHFQTKKVFRIFLFRLVFECVQAYGLLE
jgi:hypothetical protein